MVYTDDSDMMMISHWMPGRVTEFASSDEYAGERDCYAESNWRFSVIEDFNISPYPLQVQRDSVRIAPPGTFTDDFGWRFDLKAGDLVDCVDKFSVWYRSTV